MTSYVHIINKADIKDHRTLPYNAPSTTVPKGAVKARSKLLSITLTNQGYAELGSQLHWWDAFPVPEDLPAPYSNREEWGIVCSWGYGEVLESNNEDIVAGSLMYGYWPTATHPVILSLKSAGVSGHFKEVSPHRQRLMTVYNHFIVMRETELGEKQAWNSTVLTLWSAGYFLAEYPFPAQGKTAISPNGESPWSQEDGYLGDSVVINLVASGKTARGFSWNITQRSSKESNPPKALLEVSSAPEKLATAAASKIITKGVSYEDLAGKETLRWIESLSAKRIVLVDFGAPPNTAQRFHDSVMREILTLEKFDYIFAVPATIVTQDPRTSQHLFNASPLMDGAMRMEAEGVEAVYGGRAVAFDEWLDAKGMGDMDLQWSEGIQGEGGIEGTWTTLVNGDLPRRKALVFRV